jgi:hypothetical protein
MEFDPGFASRADRPEGALLDGQIDPSPLNGVTGTDIRHLAVGLLSPPAGQPQAFALTVTAFPKEPIPARFVVAAGGRIRGGTDVHPMQGVFKVDASVAYGP